MPSLSHSRTQRGKFWEKNHSRQERIDFCFHCFWPENTNWNWISSRVIWVEEYRVLSMGSKALQMERNLGQGGKKQENKQGKWVLKQFRGKWWMQRNKIFYQVPLTQNFIMMYSNPWQKWGEGLLINSVFTTFQICLFDLPDIIPIFLIIWTLSMQWAMLYHINAFFSFGQILWNLRKKENTYLKFHSHSTSFNLTNISWVYSKSQSLY